MKPYKLFCFKDTKNFAVLLFFLAACNEKFHRAKCDRHRVGWKWSTQRLAEEGMSMGLTNTHTARGFSDLYHVFAPKRCILCITSWLPYITLRYINLGFFLPLEQPSTALLASASQPCVFARLLVANNSHRLSDVSHKIMYSKRKIDNFQSLLNTLLLFQNIQKYYLI